MKKRYLATLVFWFGLSFSPALADEAAEKAAGAAAPVDKLSVVLVAIFAVIFLGERPLIKDWFGILLVAAGVVVLGLKR
jgi:uncharacterized membrane protein